MADSYFHADILPHVPAPVPAASLYTPLSPLLTPPAPPLADQTQVLLPKVGQTRCCQSLISVSAYDHWTLLSSDLQFIFLDPVFAYHLDSQAEALVGQSLLAFVHPDERETAKQDLGNVLESKTLHGSVTRVRFSRLSKVRRDLGRRGPAATWSEADKIALDDQYMAVEIVINWAADGLVLCFIHATVDLSPSDNDEEQKTGWSNWCGSPFMHQDQISLLFRRLLVCIPQTGSMNRVFQILSNDSEKTLLLSWPPDPSQLTNGGAKDFAKLVDTVNMGAGLNGANDAKTSCTRRYKALHDMPTFGGQVESIFIPHGSIIFACHKVNPSSRGPVNSTAGMQQLAFASSGYNSQGGSAFYDSNPYTLPPISTQESYTYMPQHNQGPYSPQRWSQNVTSSMSNLRSNSYIQPPAPQEHSWSQSGPHSTYSEAGAPALDGNRGPSPPYLYSPTSPTTSAGPSPTSDVVPPPRRRVSPGSIKDEQGPNARTQSNRPVGILKCSSCKATSSPEWRKGPSGKKELCNACGLRYARSRAKKEGQNQSQRRRKDKVSGSVKRETPTTQMSLSPIYAETTGVRRGYGENSFSASSAGSNPGGEIYSHTNPHLLESITPSPSPPGSNLHFLHYSAVSENRASYGNSPSYYAVSSAISTSSVCHATDAPPVPSPTSAGHQQVTHLPPISPYVNRIPSSPLTLSSFASTVTASSFERETERDRDYRDLPPTPLSAESRMKRTILSQQ